MEYNTTHVLILGAGVSGQAAAELLNCSQNVVKSITLCDRSLSPALRTNLQILGVACVESADTLPDGAFTLCVASPSIPLEHPWLQACAARGIPVISEIDLAAAYHTGPVIAITGSKGKSSLVKLCADTLTAAGRPAYACGNYGIPYAQIAREHPEAIAVVEISSFQMEHTHAFAPDTAVILNIQPEHLDRHGTLEAYVALKLKLLTLLPPGALALVPPDLPISVAVPPGVTLQTFAEPPFASTTGYYAAPILRPAVAAAIAILTRRGLTQAQIQAGLDAFEPLPHRYQTVAQKGGVTYINDSKATSLTALAAALKMSDAPIRLIAGGLAKEKDFASVKELLAKRVKKVYLIGTCAKAMFDAWNDALPCEIMGELNAAIEAAARQAQPGEIVLLAPGTASFDQFRSYNERGDAFTAKVQTITATP